MTRKFKTLGVALFAALALTAVSASAAMASNFTASAYPATGTAESPSGNDIFTTEAGKEECKVHYQGTLAGASPTLTVTPKYTNCRSMGFLETTISMGSCDYLLAAHTGSGDNWSATTQIKCTNPASPITKTSGTCKLTMGEQSPSGSVSITNNTAAGDMSLKANLSGLNYTVVTDGFGCPFNGTGAKTGATYVQAEAITFDSTNGPTIDVG